MRLLTPRHRPKGTQGNLGRSGQPSQNACHVDIHTPPRRQQQQQQQQQYVLCVQMICRAGLTENQQKCILRHGCVDCMATNTNSLNARGDPARHLLRQGGRPCWAAMAAKTPQFASGHRYEERLGSQGLDEVSICWTTLGREYGPDVGGLTCLVGHGDEAALWIVKIGLVAFSWLRIVKRLLSSRFCRGPVVRALKDKDIPGTVGTDVVAGRAKPACPGRWLILYMTPKGQQTDRHVLIDPLNTQNHHPLPAPCSWPRSLASGTSQPPAGCWSPHLAFCRHES